ncbi:MAG TPA: GNAT family N-acetyltransferase, partial [Vicinamibacteria bacterium]
ADGLPASLETLNERNLSFYRRHGFEVAAEGQVPEGGPPYWVLRREPRARGRAAARA